MFDGDAASVPLWLAQEKGVDDEKGRVRAAEKPVIQGVTRVRLDQVDRMITVEFRVNPTACAMTPEGPVNRAALMDRRVKKKEMGGDKDGR